MVKGDMGVVVGWAWLAEFAGSAQMGLAGVAKEVVVVTALVLVEVD